MLATSPPPSRARYLSIVAESKALCREHYRVALRIEGHFPATEPGQFIQIGCRDETLLGLADGCEREMSWSDGESGPVTLPHLQSTEMTAAVAFLRRPFSLAGRRDLLDAGSRTIATELDIILRVVGVGTDWLSHLAPGDTVSILGPLGNRFRLPATDETALLVGGGVGIPPMLYLAEKLAGKPAIAFCGALSADLLPLTITGPLGAPAAAPEPSQHVFDFSRHGIPAIISTDDGSAGFRGFITQALERYLDANPSRPHIVYTCGPEPMMKRVAEIGLTREIPVQVAVERAMACGMGTCQSCCIRVKTGQPPPNDWVYKLACTDGPVFAANDLLW